MITYAEGLSTPMVSVLHAQWVSTDIAVYSTYRCKVGKPGIECHSQLKDGAHTVGDSTLIFTFRLTEILHTK